MENPAPMVNDNIAKWIKACDKLLTKAKKSRTDHVTNLIRQTNQACFKSKVSENGQDLRKLWNLIKFLSGSGNHNCGLQQLVDNDGTISNKVEIAKTLNSFFLNLQNNLSVIVWESVPGAKSCGQPIWLKLGTEVGCHEIFQKPIWLTSLTLSFRVSGGVSFFALWAQKIHPFRGHFESAIKPNW